MNKRLAPVDADRNGFPSKGKVISVVPTRETVWIQYVDSGEISKRPYADVFAIPERAEGTIMGGRPFVGYNSVSPSARNIVMTSVDMPYRNDVRFR